MSKAFEKSSEMGSDDSRLITEWRREMMAAVVDPVGRNANWSANSVDKAYKVI